MLAGPEAREETPLKSKTKKRGIGGLKMESLRPLFFFADVSTVTVDILPRGLLVGT